VAEQRNISQVRNFIALTVISKYVTGVLCPWVADKLLMLGLCIDLFLYTPISDCFKLYVLV